jgi:hypothetical protein
MAKPSVSLTADIITNKRHRAEPRYLKIGERFLTAKARGGSHEDVK